MKIGVMSGLNAHAHRSSVWLGSPHRIMSAGIKMTKTARLAQCVADRTRSSCSIELAVADIGPPRFLAKRGSASRCARAYCVAPTSGETRLRVVRLALARPDAEQVSERLRPSTVDDRLRHRERRALQHRG